MNEANSTDQRIQGVLSRLAEVIDAENAAIGTDSGFDLTRSNALKSRCLYDMTILFRDISPSSLGPAHRNLLDAVKAKLAINSVKVRAHMDAVRDIAELIKETVTAAEADGTYSVDQFRCYELS